MTGIGMKRTAKKKPLNKVSKLPRSKLVKKVDTVFSQYMRAVQGKCEYCGTTGKLNLHHGIAHRRFQNTRFMPENVVVLCPTCHWLFGDFPRINNDFFVKRNGSDILERVEIIARSGKKVTTEYLEELLEKYTTALKSLE
jgi:hypothetical protein